ncbi:phage tail protein [Saccharicrinis sp. GN24d3]|uniref:phage tail protein n=1 Tax=Saccharicrinis sp. GN24d3 TaxID=3458416 RepID=UPI004036AFBC
MAEYYPPLGFHFKVEFDDIDGESEFQSVAGLSVELQTEDIAEGGENRFKHKLPTRTSYPNLVLKRGAVVGSGLIKWCRDAVENFDISPTNVKVTLLNEEHEPLTTWNIVHAWPLKWSVTDFSAEESKLVVETIELSYNYFNIL